MNESYVLGYSLRGAQPLLVMIAFVFQDGWSPLMAASWKGHVEVVKSLIDAGANISHSNKVGMCICYNIHH
jgi:ankyrin repeat protein